MAEFQTADFSGALETAVAAQFALFAVAAGLMARDGTRALYFLCGAAVLITVMLVGNFLSAAHQGMHWVNSANVFLELLVGPAVFMYVRVARPDGSAPNIRSLLHLAPVPAGLVVYLFAGPWLDGFIVSITLGYITAAGWLLWKGHREYPALFLRFAGGLLVLFTAAPLVRVLIAVDADVTAGFRTTAGYLLLLTIVLLASWYVLFAALRWPNALRATVSPRKYARTGADPDILYDLAGRLASLVRTEHPYTSAELTLKDVARSLDASPRHVSQLINSAYGMNFSAYMNHLRAHAAAKMLCDWKPGTPIKTIMYDAGFRSKSAFAREFRRCFGMTPSEFRQRRQDPATDAFEDRTRHPGRD